MNGMPLGMRSASLSSIVWTVLCMRALLAVPGVLRASERVEALLRRKVHVRDGDSLAPAHAKAHGGDDNAVGLHVVHAEAAHEIQAALDTGKAVEQLFGARQVIHQREYLDRIGPDIETEGRALPVDHPPGAALIEELTTPITQADPDGATTLFTANDGHRLPFLLQYLPEHLAQVFRAILEKIIGRLDDFVIAVRRVAGARRRGLAVARRGA